MKKIFTFIALAMLCSVGINAQDVWTIVGNKAIMNGDGDWQVGNTENDMATADGGATYTLTVTGKTLEADKAYEYKAAKDHAWTVAVPQVGNQSLKVTENGIYTIVYTLTTATNTLTYETTKTGDAGEVTHTYSIAGSSTDLFGAEWSETNTATDMTKNDDGIYTWTKEDVTLPAGTIEYKVVEDHAWGISYGNNGGNATIVIEDAGNYDVTITFNPETKAVNGVATPKGSVTEHTFTVNIIGCDEGYAKVGENSYKNGDTFKSASETPKVDAGHIVGYAVTAPVIDGTNVNVTYEYVGTVDVTVNVTNNTGDDLRLFACEGLTWANLNVNDEEWPGDALDENDSAVVTMTKDDYLHMILNNGNGKQTANIGGDEGILVSENTTIAITVSNNTEGERYAYVFTIDNIATAIANASAPAAQTMSIYSISGQRLQKAQRGLNIINGKKVVVM